MQYITQAIRVDSNNHGTVAENPAPALIMGQETELVLFLMDEQGQPFIPQNIGGVQEWRFVLAGDFDQKTANCLTVSAAPSAFDGNGWFRFDVSDTWTAEMVSYLGGAEYKPIQAEIIGIGSAGETKDDWVFQFQTYIRNRVDAIGHSAPSAITPYVTSADLAEERAEYLEPILSGVESIMGDLSNFDHGLPTIAENVDSINGMVDTIDNTVRTLATSAQANGIQATLNNSTNGLSAIRSGVADVYQYLDGMIYGNVCDAAAYSNSNYSELTNQNHGLSAIKSTVDTLATSAQAATVQGITETIANQCAGIYSSTNNGIAAIIESQTFGLVQLTNKVSAIQTAIGDIQTALSTITGVA